MNSATLLPPEYAAVLPELVLTAAATMILVVDLWLSPAGRKSLGYLSFLGVILALLAVLTAVGRDGQYWGDMIAVDAFALFFKTVFLIVAALVSLTSIGYVTRHGVPAAEFYALLLSATVGMLLMGSSRDLLVIYLGLELTSISSYVLAGLLRHDPRSNEAAIKYFLNGALASGVLLFGLSLLYGLTATTHLDVIAQNLQVGRVSLPVLLAAMIFVIGGFGFKIAAVPFHFWAPDAYEGAPTPVTAFFSVGPKGGVFAAILRTFLLGLPALAPRWAGIFAVLALITMTVGNLTALWQTNIKRMMAYSSIAHAGYLLVGIAAGSLLGTQAVLFYLLAYAFMNLGAFAVITALDTEGPGAEIKDYIGLSQRSPWLAWTLTLFFISMIGIPPTAGFLGKLLLFSAALQGGYLWLALAIAVNSAISVGYYYGVVRNMFLVAPADRTPVGSSLALHAALVVGVAGTLLIGLWAGPFLDWTYLGASLPRF